MELKTVKIYGTSVTITISENGEFQAHVAGDWFTTDTLDALVSQLRAKLQKTRVRIALPATLLTDDEAINVVILGLNTNTGDVQFRLADGNDQKVKTKQRYDDKLCRLMTDEDRATYVRLGKEQRAAQRAFEAFVNRHAYKDAEKTVKAAIANAVDDPKESDE